MDSFRDFIDRRKNGVAIGLIVLVLMFLSGFHIYQKGIRHIEIQKLDNFTAVYIQDAAKVILIARNIELILQPTELGTLIRFIRACISCKSHCSVSSGDFTLELGPSLWLHIANFTPCSMPNMCSWHGYSFNCQDLMGIVNLVTGKVNV